MEIRTLLKGARLGPSGPIEDVLIDSGRVAAIGAIEDAGDIDDVYDLDGRFVLPGLWDHHVHFDQWAQVSARVDLSKTESAAAAAHVMAQRCARSDADLAPPIVGYGFRAALWSDSPHRDLLDESTGGRPVVLISGDLHSAWLNTAALARFGEQDHPTGLLREDAAMRVITAVAEVAEDVGDTWAADAARAAATRGVVGIVDMEQPWSLATWQRRMASGERSLRVVSSVWPDHLAEVIATGLHTGNVIEGTGGLLTAGPLKVIIDGSLNTRTAYCHEAYPGSADAGDRFGVLLVPVPDLVSLMQRASASRLACAIHAIGDHANAIALDAFAHTGAHGSIEHAQLLDDDDVRRFAKLGVVASVQPEHALDDRDVADRYWAGRTRRAFPLRKLLDAGAVLAFGSDAPVAPLDPWVTIAAAVHRSRDERSPWHPEQEITLREALTASIPQGREPRVRAGDPADLMVLDDDPFAATPERLRTMTVAATMVAGHWTHRTGI